VRRPLVLLLAAGGLLLSGCGTVTEAVRGGGFEPGDVTPVVLHLEDGQVELAPWAYCLGNGCADGAPPAELHHVGSPTEVPFTFARDDWTFDATFKEHGDACARMITVPVEKTGDQAFVIRPAGLAGDWDVDVFGRGNGDVITTFRWTTPVDGEMPPPASGSAAVLADHDGELDSYGVELGATNLDVRPERATAVITVTSASGETTAITPRWQRSCYSEGDLWFTAPRSAGLAATRIGTGPFTYTVELTLDGTTYQGVGTWPTDETPDAAPAVPLTWTPELPSYDG
jgi:hypothetical protein